MWLTGLFVPAAAGPVLRGLPHNGGAETLEAKALQLEDTHVIVFLRDCGVSCRPRGLELTVKLQGVARRPGISSGRMHALQSTTEPGLDAPKRP